MRFFGSADFRGFSPRRVYFGWWVSVAGAFNMVFSAGPTFQAASVLFKAIEDEFGWSRTVISGVATFGRLGNTLLGPIEGWLVDTFGSGKMVLVGFTLGGAGLILFSVITGPVQCYLAFLLLSVGLSSGRIHPVADCFECVDDQKAGVRYVDCRRWSECRWIVGSRDCLGNKSIRLANDGVGDGDNHDLGRTFHRMGYRQTSNPRATSHSASDAR